MEERQVSDRDIATIARDYLPRWEDVSPYLGLTGQDEEVIRATYRNYGDQRREALKLWKRKRGRDATYRAFSDAATEAGNADLADNVKDLARKSGQASAAATNSPPPPPTPNTAHEPELTVNDLLDVTGLLMHLSKPEIKTLGPLLGLCHATVTNTYEGSSQRMYLDSIITAWLKKQDDVITKGGPHWSFLVKALESEHMRQNGIATDIRKKKLSQ